MKVATFRPCFAASSLLIRLSILMIGTFASWALASGVTMPTLEAGAMMMAWTWRFNMIRTRSACLSASLSDSMPETSMPTPNSFAFSRAPFSIAWKKGLVVAL